MEQFREIILASSSPRRKEILERNGVVFEIAVSSRKEPSYDGSESPESFARRTAESKLCNVLSDNPRLRDCLVLAYDTVVASDGKIFGKPSDSEEAFRMLSQLSGKTHSVFTGFSFSVNGKIISGAEETKVSFRELSADEIVRYFTDEKPFDKAGSYAIQEGGGAFVSSICGDYDNVVGLPFNRTLEALKDAFGIRL